MVHRDDAKQHSGHHPRIVTASGPETPPAQDTLAVALFRECAAVSVACHWAWAGLGRTKILEGKLPEAASHIQQVRWVCCSDTIKFNGRVGFVWATGCSEA